jgi:hypothetical protein
MPQQQQVPRFSWAAIEALRDTPAFRDWNREFDRLIGTIRRRVSARDLQPLLKAGAEEKRLLTLLALAVTDSDNNSLSKLMVKRRALDSLANQLATVTNHATRVVNDPEYDGRFWLAAQGLLSWDLVPKAGAIEARVLANMRALAQLVKARGDALGSLSRTLKKTSRNTAIRDLLAYVWLSTGQQSRFDAEIAWLLTAAHRAAGREKDFTADKVKKFRQRHLPNRQNLKMPAAIMNGGAKGQRKSLGQRIAGI